MPRIKNPAALKIAYWNAQSLLQKKLELQNFMYQHNIDIMLVGETYLKPTKNLKIANYTCHRNDRIDNQGGGTAIYMKNNLNHCQLPRFKLTDLEANGIKIQTKAGTLKVVAAYYPPLDRRTNINDIKTIIDEDTPTIIMGDLNAKHSTWNSRTNNPRGNKLHKYFDTTDAIVIGPDAPTHFAHQGGHDVLDIAIIKLVKQNCELKVLYELSSDHYPILLTLGNEQEQDVVEINTTDWYKFRTELKTTNHTITNEEELESAAVLLENNIKAALLNSTITKTEKVINEKIPQHLEQLMKDKNKIKRRYFITLDPQDKTRLNNATKQVKKALEEHRSKKWNKLLNDCEEEEHHKRLWKIVKGLKKTKAVIPPLKTNAGFAITDDEKCEAIADSLELQYSPNPLTADQLNKNYENKVNERLKKILEKDDDISIEETTNVEILNIIKNLKLYKTPGLDKINNKILKELTEEAITALKDIVNATLKFKHFPKNYKITETIILPKPGKPLTEPASYRPISLLKSLSKIIEKIILQRLTKQLQENNILPHEQHGFRPQHGTQHQLARISNAIIRGYNWNKCTVGVFLDVEKAFDKVWHQGLLVKATRLGIPKTMIKLLNTYLTDRTFTVKINNSYSSVRKIQAGIPQGSILGPTLFNIYTADIPKPKKCQLALYADDTLIYAQSIQPDSAAKKVQDYINILEKWLQHWRIKINPHKTIPINFSRNTKKPTTKITLQNQELDWQKEAKYLGIILDTKLTFGSHVKEARNKANRARCSLYPLLNRNSKLSPEVRIKIYRSVIRPIMTYGSIAWHTASNTTLRQLETIQNKTLRIATGAPFYMRNEQIRRETNTPTITEFINKLNDNTIHNIEQHTNPTINDIVNYHTYDHWKYKVPIQGNIDA